jgi:hypothetical protein
MHSIVKCRDSYLIASPPLSHRLLNLIKFCQEFME